MARFLDWLREIIAGEESEPEEPIWQSPARGRSTPPKPVPRDNEAVDFSSDLGGKIVDGGPGKNVLIKNKYVREDTGTHETLKIVDDSILETEEEMGADPYNTGRFDRSKSWDSFRNRK